MARVSIAGLELAGEVSFAFEEEPEELGLSGDAPRFEGRICAAGRIFRTGKSFRVEGAVRCRRTFLCDRCLEPGEEEQEIPFSEDVGLSGLTDSGEYLLDGDLLDLSSLIRDTVLAAQPIQNLCSTECRGLCPSCGANLNLGDCSCGSEAIDPRWAALASWRQGEE